MKKITAIIITILIACLACTACSNTVQPQETTEPPTAQETTTVAIETPTELPTDTSISSLIIGKWSKDDTEHGDVIYKFKDDGTFSLFNEFYYGKPATFTGTYKFIDEKTIEMTGKQEGTEKEPTTGRSEIEIKNNKIYITEKNSSGEDETITLTKID